MGLEAATKALLDAGITYDEVQAAFAGYCYGDSTSGQVTVFNDSESSSANTRYTDREPYTTLALPESLSPM